MSITDTPHRGLLPAGLSDMLPPEAALEARAMELVMGRLAAHGYQRVKPPLVEFEESLLGGPGAALAKDTFRLMDPVSQRMMGVRPDMTVQLARIAVTRLKDAPRPLRLSYAGNVIRVRGSQLRPERQFAQVGAELIGPDSTEADAETVLLAVEALRAVGVANLSVDLNLPTLVTAVCGALALPGATVARLRRALEGKDEDAVRQALSTGPADLFVGLLRSVGPAGPGMAALLALGLPAEARAEADRLAAVVRLVQAAAPDLRLTIDPVEYRGLEYQTGVSFTFYALDTRGELGRGGRYRAGYPEDEMAADSSVVPIAGAVDERPARGIGHTEPATGFTLYMDTVSSAARLELPGKRLYVPAGTAWAELARWQQEGYLTVRGLAPDADPRSEARRLACGHVLVSGKPVEV